MNLIGFVKDHSWTGLLKVECWRHTKHTQQRLIEVKVNFKFLQKINQSSQHIKLLITSVTDPKETEDLI